MRLKIADLLPGTNYAVQVRAVREGVSSEWSERFLFTTDQYSPPPAAPTNVTWSVLSDSFVGSWSPVSTDTVGNRAIITSYELELDASGTKRYVTVVPKTESDLTYTLTFANNAALFLTPRPNLSFRVRAINNKGIKGTWSSVINAVNPAPSPVTNLVATSLQDAVEISWTAPTDTDLTEYAVYVGSSTGFTPNNATNRVFRGLTTRTTYVSTTYGSDLFFKVAAVDKFDQYSTYVTSSAVRPTSPFVVDTTPPATPTALSATITNNASGIGARASVSWAMASPPSDLAGYYVRFRRVGDTNWTVNSFAKDDLAGIIELQAAYTNHEFQIKAFDWQNNESAWSATVTATSPANAVPANVTGLTNTPGKDSITYRWNASADTDLKTYEVTFAQSSDFLTAPLTFFTGTSPTLTVGGLSPSTNYYARVRAVDNGGLTSAAWSGTSNATTTAFPMSDGNAPASSPTPTVVGGLGYVYATWTPVANADPVTYEVHMSTTSGFTPVAGTKATEVSGTFALIDTLPQSSTALTYGTTYYIKLIAKDRDGAAAAGAQGSAAPSKIGAVDSNLTPADIGSPTLAQFNTAVKTYSVEYALNSSETTAPTTGWSTTAPTRTPGNFIWTRTVITFQDNSTSTTSAALLTGNTGASGSAGAAAAYIYLTANAQVLSSPAAGGATNPTTSTVTGTAVNTTITAWTYSVDGAAFSATVPTGVSRTGNVVTITGSTMTARTIAVRMADANGVADTLTVAKVLDGAAGAAGGTGAAGADAYTVLLSNEAHVFPGTTSAAVAGSVTTSVIAYKGGTQIAATIGTIPTLPTGLSATINNNGTTTASVTFTATTSLTQQNGTVAIPLTVDGKSFTQTFSWSVSYTGATGATGSTGATGVGVSTITPYFLQQTAGGAAPATPTTNPPGGSWVTSEPAYVGGTELWRTERVVYTNSTFAYTTPTKVSSYDLAAQALTAANGKNKITHSTGVPGTAANTAGDLWIQVDSLTAGITQNIIGQWRGTGGTGWESEAIKDEFIANLSASKLVANSTFTSNLNVKSTFTLGDATTPGIIKSYNHNTATKVGFSLSSAGLEIWQGKVSAAVLETGTTITNNLGITGTLTISSTGNLQSTNYIAGSAGWRIGSAGAEFNDSGSSVAADAIKAGTLGGSSGSGVINIAAGTSLIFNGGYLKSNTNTGSTMATAVTSGTGFYLGNDGLFIGSGANGGQVKANALVSDTLTATTITLGSGGSIVGGTWTLNDTGLIIPNGGVKANKIELQLGANFMPQGMADFEMSDAWYQANTTVLATGTGTASRAISTARSKYNNQSMKVSWLTQGTGAAADLYLTTSNTNYNIQLEASTTYIVSVYVFAEPGEGSKNCRFFRNEDGLGAAVVTGAATAVLDNGTWQRVTASFTTTATTTKGNLRFRLQTLGSVYIDGFQIEKQLNTAVVASEWKPPGLTRIDGGMIQTGEIRSTNNVTINGVSEPVWSIPLNGAATFSGMRVLGNTVLGNGSTDTTSILQSSNYIQGEKGWMIRADGDAEFDAAALRGTLTVSRIQGGTLDAQIELAEGSYIVASGEMGEEIKLGSDGFSVLGAHETPVVSKSVTGGNVTLTTATPHGYAEGAKVVVYNAGTPFPTETTAYVATSVTSTTLTILGVGGTDLPTTPVTGASVFGLDTTGTRQQPELVNFPTDGTRPNIISGLLTATNLVVNNGATFRGVSGIETSAELTIASAILAPTAAPVISAAYNMIQQTDYSYFKTTGFVKGHSNKVFYVGNGVLATYTPGVFARLPAPAGLIVELNPTTGKYVTFIAPAIGNETIQSMTFYNNFYYLLTKSGSSHYVYTYNTSFVQQGSRVTIATGYTDSQAAIGINTVAGRLMFACQPNNNGNVVVNEYTITAGIPSGTVNTTYSLNGTSSTNDFGSAFIGRGLFDFGVEKVVYKASDYNKNDAVTKAYLVFSTTGTTDSAYNWPVALSKNVAGAYFDTTDSKFYDMDDHSVKRQYTGGAFSTWATTALTDKRWVAYAWAQYSGTQPYANANLTAQTNISPGAMLDMPKRATLSVTVNQPPTGANAVRIWAADADNQPAKNSATWKLYESLAAPLTSTKIDSYFTPDASVPPLGNSFSTSSASPGQIRSTSGKSFWKGDDSAQFLQLRIAGPNFATSNAGNTPPLKIGNLDLTGVGETADAEHLRIDGNNMVAMLNNTTRGVFTLSADDIKFNMVNGGLQFQGGSNYIAKIRTITDAGTALIFENNRMTAGNSGYVSTGPGPANTVNFNAAEFHGWASTGAFIDESLSGGGSTTATINNSGKIVRTASSLKYKKLIKDLTAAEAYGALNLRAVSFKWRVDMDMGDVRVPGFIAEEAHEAGMEMWVTYDAAGNPDGFRYAELTAAHNVLIKELWTKNEELQAANTALEARIAAVEAALGI